MNERLLLRMILWTLVGFGAMLVLGTRVDGWRMMLFGIIFGVGASLSDQLIEWIMEKDDE